MSNRLLVIIAIVVAVGIRLLCFGFFVPIQRSTPPMGIQATPIQEANQTAQRIPGVPADTIGSSRKVAGDLFNASFALEHGIGVEQNHVAAVALKARSDAIYDLINEIQSQPVTGKPSDARKKLAGLKALRDFAKLDEE